MSKRLWMGIGVISLWMLALPAVQAAPVMCELAPTDGPQCDPNPPLAPVPDGYTGFVNPATGRILAAPGDDPLAIFARRPLDTFIIPEGGQFMDPLHDGPHYGVDYTSPDDYLHGRPIPIYPIGPGYVTTRSTCTMCFVDGDSLGRVNYRKPQYNFGWGGLVLVETPYTPNASIYVLYAHLHSDWVSLGDYIEPDEAIALVGSSGYSEEIHVHLEVRYGAPGRFWNADFRQQEVLDRWLATPVINPAVLVFPDSHPSFVTTLSEWASLRPRPSDLP